MCASPTSPPFFGGEFTYAQLNYTSTVDASAHHSVEIWCQSRPSQLLQAPNLWNKIINHTLPKPPEVPHPSVSTFPGTFGHQNGGPKWKKFCRNRVSWIILFLKTNLHLSGNHFCWLKTWPTEFTNESHIFRPISWSQSFPLPNRRFCWAWAIVWVRLGLMK